MIQYCDLLTILNFSPCIGYCIFRKVLAFVSTWFTFTNVYTKNSVASCKMKEKRPALIGYLARPQRLKCNQSGYFGDLMKRSLFVEQHNLCHDTRAHGIVFLSDVFTLINLSGYSLASGAFFTSGETGMERNFY